MKDGARAARNLRQAAEAVLHDNDLGEWTKPAPNLYPHQWNWDSCFIAIGLSHLDTQRACTEIRSLLRGQWRNGMVPQIVFNPAGEGYFPGPKVWQTERSGDAPRELQTSGITQPPVLATAVRRIWEKAHDKSAVLPFLREVYPKVLAHHRFLHEVRDPQGTGLSVVVHPWESGLDNSPPYLEAGSRVRMAYRPQYQRLDILHVQAANRPSDKDYDLYVYLLEHMRDLSWDQREIAQSNPLRVEDVLFNSVLCGADRDLIVIGQALGEPVSEIEKWRDRTRCAIDEQLWDEERGVYYCRDRVTGQLLREDTVMGLSTLYGGIPTQERAERMVRAWLAEGAPFWPTNGHPVPTTSPHSGWFLRQNYWRGPVWVNTNWMVAKGLEEYGRRNEASRLRQRTVELVKRGGFREYFDPFDGAGYGTDGFSWSAALTIDMWGEQL